MASRNMEVFVRVRPPNAREGQVQKYQPVVEVVDKNILVFDPDREHLDYTQRLAMNKRANKNQEFAFDEVFHSNATNTAVYQSTTKPLLSHLLKGINCSVFAYGATGAGKTFTMLGSQEHHGIIALTMSELFQRISGFEDRSICVSVSYLEIYNEIVKDLLSNANQSEGLPLRENKNGRVTICGLSSIQPSSAEEIMQILLSGNARRTQHPTDANQESSRSHAVFRVTVEQTTVAGERVTGMMTLIDLAGSERATVTTNRGVRLQEGANINRSLLALGNLINALADGKEGRYRDSNLTRILKESLDGNCCTVMIANVSPSALSHEDTYNTLKYANRAKRISVSLKRNVEEVMSVQKYQAIIKGLRSTNAQLKSKVERLEHWTGEPAESVVTRLITELSNTTADSVKRLAEAGLMTDSDKGRLLSIKLLIEQLPSTYDIAPLPQELFDINGNASSPPETASLVTTASFGEGVGTSPATPPHPSSLLSSTRKSSVKRSGGGRLARGEEAPTKSTRRSTMVLDTVQYPKNDTSRNAPSAISSSRRRSSVFGIDHSQSEAEPVSHRKRSQDFDAVTGGEGGAALPDRRKRRRTMTLTNETIEEQQETEDAGVVASKPRAARRSTFVKPSALPTKMEFRETSRRSLLVPPEPRVSSSSFRRRSIVSQPYQGQHKRTIKNLTGSHVYVDENKNVKEETDNRDITSKHPRSSSAMLNKGNAGSGRTPMKGRRQSLLPTMQKLRPRASILIRKPLSEVTR